jgi:hypothetical protein
LFKIFRKQLVQSQKSFWKPLVFVLIVFRKY